MTRIAHLVFQNTDAVKVDFQNHRLHFIVYKPYDDEKRRIEVSVAIADHFLRVLEGANELHDELENVEVRVGIESGVSLAVNNGTRGDREPLFVGNPANHAAKLLAGIQTGIFLGAVAREAMGEDWHVERPVRSPLSASQVADCVEAAELGLDVEKHLAAWEAELKDSPLSEVTFSRPTPPLAGLNWDRYTPENSGRIEAASMYADIDGFTSFVAKAIEDGDAAQAEAVQLLHVIRKELRDVLKDFGGRKVRYIGDCVHGVLAEGSTKTDDAQTVSTSVLCAAAMRDAFGLILDELPAGASLGLAIGIETGPISLTRLGVKGSRSRCASGRAVSAAEALQGECNGRQTAIGDNALGSATDAVKQLFKNGKKRTDLGYLEVAYALDSAKDEAAKRVTVSVPTPSIIVPKAHARN